MLGRKTTEQAGNTRISSIIGEDMVIEGNVTAKETVRVEGTVKGDLKTEGVLLISGAGKVYGNVKGSDIKVAGTIEGDLHAEGKIEVSATGKIIGNIRTRSLVIDENAVFQGQCVMNTEHSPVSREHAAPADENGSGEKK